MLLQEGQHIVVYIRKGVADDDVLVGIFPNEFFGLRTEFIVDVLGTIGPHGGIALRLDKQSGDRDILECLAVSGDKLQQFL